VTGDKPTLSARRRGDECGGGGGTDSEGLVPPHIARTTCLESIDKASNVSDSDLSFVVDSGMSIFDEREGEGIYNYSIYKTDA